MIVFGECAFQAILSYLCSRTEVEYTRPEVPYTALIVDVRARLDIQVVTHLLATPAIALTRAPNQQPVDTDIDTWRALKRRALGCRLHLCGNLQDRLQRRVTRQAGSVNRIRWQASLCVCRNLLFEGLK
jgi:hypothetical protein